jgi:hypothetical protein
MKNTDKRSGRAYFEHMRDVLGFDESTRNKRGSVTVRCSQCEAVAINGTACHEHGCPNRSHKCRECGDTLRHGTECNCGDPVETE